MQFQGDIASIPVTDVAQNLGANRKTGTLTLRRATEVRRIAFQDGKIISYTDNLGFSVPRWFAEKGLVEADALKKAWQKSRKSRRKGLGDYLCGAGAISSEDYRAHVASLFEEMLYETFTLRDGKFEFEENRLDDESLDKEIRSAKLEIQIGPIIIEAARRLDDWEAIRKCLPSESDFYRVTPAERAGCVKEMEGDLVALAAIDLLDGTRSIREVLAAVPASRFEGSRAIADLVTRKVARPIEGAALLAQVGVCQTAGEKTEALARLKAALEREPGNRDLLRRVAELSEVVGSKEESGVRRKMLASALQDDGDIDGAEKELRRSLKLNPQDLAAWQKLYELLALKPDTDSLHAFGSEMARHLRGLGLVEVARDHLARMLDRFPDDSRLRCEHAEALFGVGDRVRAVESLLALSRDLLKKGKLDEGERVLAKVIEYDRDHKRAKEIYEKVRTGNLARQRTRRRAFVRAAGRVAVLCCIVIFLGYDLFVRRELVLTTREVFAEGLLENARYREAADRFRSVRDRHSWSLVRFLEASELVDGLEEAARRREAEEERPPEEIRLTPAPAGAPAPAPTHAPTNTAPQPRAVPASEPRKESAPPGAPRGPDRMK